MSARAIDLGHDLLHHVREEHVQRGLALVAGITSGLSGLEVAYMHYRGSYSRRIMWTPIVMSQALLAAGIAGAVRPHLARTLLPAVAGVTLADCAVGFVFHWRGIHRKPGGYRMLVNNVVMGPPPFAPLLFGMSAYIGILAARPANPTTRKHVAVVTAIATSCSGVEALYSHYKNNFRFKAQYTPLIVAPLLAAAALSAVANPRGRQKLLAAASMAAMLDGSVGFLYHLRGIARRPGGRRHWLYNLIYGPPVLAPLLFAGCGFLGLIAVAMAER